MHLKLPACLSARLSFTVKMRCLSHALERWRPSQAGTDRTVQERDLSHRWLLASFLQKVVRSSATRHSAVSAHSTATIEAAQEGGQRHEGTENNQASSRRSGMHTHCSRRKENGCS
jgi:hypothetical protein